MGFTPWGTIASTVGNLINSFAMKKAAKKQTAQNFADLSAVGNYKENAMAGQNLGMFQNLYNSRMPGAAVAEGNIFQNQANVIDRAGAGATDASQYLDLVAGTQGQVDKSLVDIGAQEGQFKLNAANGLSNAYQLKIAEGDKVWQDQLRAFQQRMGIRGVDYQNKFNINKDLMSGLNMGGSMFDYFKKK